MGTLQQGGSELARWLVTVLERHVGPLTAQTIVTTGCSRAHLAAQSLRAEHLYALVPELERGLKLFLNEPAKQQACLAEIVSVGRSPKPAPRVPLMPTRVKVPVEDELGTLEARAMARQIANDLGFSFAAQAEISTAVAELARNIVRHAGKGTVSLVANPVGSVTLEVVAEDQGPGIPDAEAALSGKGQGLRTAQRLMDRFEIESAPGRGAKIVAVKRRR